MLYLFLYQNVITKHVIFQAGPDTPLQPSVLAQPILQRNYGLIINATSSPSYR